MRVIFVQPDYTKFFFGAEKLVYLYCQGLAEHGHDVRLVCIKSSFSKYPGRGELFKVQALPGFTRYFRNITELNLLSDASINNRLTNSYLKDQTVIISDFLCAPAFLGSNNYSKKLLVSAYHWARYGPTKRKTLSDYVTAYQYAFCQRRWDKVLRKAKGYIAITQAVKDHFMQDYGIPASKVSLIPEVVDTKRYYPRKGTRYLRNRFADPDEVVILAMPHHRHSPLLLLKLIRKLKGITNRRYKLVIIGNMPVSERKTLLEFARQNGIEENCKILGFVPDSILPLVYSNADIFLNIGVNRGMTVLEAMASGLPVVSSDFIFSHDWITQGVNGYVVKRVPDELAILDSCEDELSGYLRVLIEDDKLLRSMSANSRKVAVEKFDYKVVSKTMEEVFLNVLESNL
jgi:glycosyltransferase involved in cell wall biosynthesis